jgi:NAD(P)-dependent dehydrogenase (short-subunit alcohol dehydrogenase family)
MTMQQETVVVFGGSSGIGEATARLAERAGARVIIVGRSAARLAAARERLAGRVESAALDGADGEAVARWFSDLGGFDHLLLSLSGGKGAGALRELDLDELRQGFEAKFFPQLTVLQAALPTLRPSGSVTFISAGSARSAIPGTVGLAAINAAIEAAVPILALELAPVRVNAISPGIIDTPWWDALPSEVRSAYFAHAERTLPVGRVGKPEEVASLVVSVMQNGFITGSVFEIDGGGRLV